MVAHVYILHPVLQVILYNTINVNKNFFLVSPSVIHVNDNITNHKKCSKAHCTIMMTLNFVL